MCRLCCMHCSHHGCFRGKQQLRQAQQWLPQGDGAIPADVLFCRNKARPAFGQVVAAEADAMAATAASVANQTACLDSTPWAVCTTAAPTSSHGKWQRGRIQNSAAWTCMERHPHAHSCWLIRVFQDKAAQDQDWSALGRKESLQLAALHWCCQHQSSCRRC